MTGRRRWRHGLAAIACYAALLPAAAAQDTTDYTIANYELTVELQPGSGTARVTMDLTYRIASGTKSEGFKYIGTFRPTGVTGTEDGGRPIDVTVERQRETMIKWRFTPAGRGEKHVQIGFTLPATLAGTRAENLFRADWAGVFKVPVARSVYRLVLPDDWTDGTIRTEPSEFRRTTIDGRPAFEIEQRPLAETAFVATITPGIADTGQTTVVGSVSGGRAGGLGPSFGFVMLIVGLVVVVIAVARANRGKKRSADGSYASGGSSCAGGSSCSSSCGGGGCGGGCGG